MLPMRNVAGASASPVILQKTLNQPWDSDLPGRERKYWIVVLYDLLKVGKLDTLSSKPFEESCGYATQGRNTSNAPILAEPVFIAD